MEIKVLEEGKKKMILELEGASHTLCNALRKELWEDKNTNLAGYNVPHPLIAKPIIVVEGDNPKKSLQNAVKRCKTKFEKLKKSAKEIK